MSNNICLSPSWPSTQLFYRSNSQTSLADSPNSPCFKDGDLFLKSQVSMADTTCDDHSPISHKFQDNATHQHSFSLTEFNLEDSRSGTEDEPTCQEFLQKGFCMKGIQCTKIHDKNVENTEQSQERPSILVTIFQSMPEMLIYCRKTRGYFAK